MLTTARLHLVPCRMAHFEAILQHDTARLAQLLQAHVPEDWTDFEEAFASASPHLTHALDVSDWWVYLVVYVPENVLVGSCGFKGQPSQGGVVEIGYEVSEAYRNRGLATEVAGGLIQFAFSHESVKKVIAHTLSENNASASVLKKNGMQCVTSFDDPEEGWLWQWELLK